MLPELNSALVSGKQADRGSGEAVSRKKSAVFLFLASGIRGGTGRPKPVSDIMLRTQIFGGASKI